MTIEVLRDVDVPLSGPGQGGRAAVRAAEEALLAALERVDEGLRTRRLGELLPAGVANWSGAGAAGGLGVALYALVRGAGRRGGVLDLVGLRETLAGAVFSA